MTLLEGWEPITESACPETHKSSGSITADLAAVWPEVERSIRRYLSALGASPQLAEDLAQEVAVKVLTSSVAFTAAADLTPWCLVVARNALHNQRRDRLVLVPSVPESPTNERVEDQVTARLELKRVLSALAQLSPTDRELILAPLHTSEPTQARRDAVRQNVARFRARSRLAKLLVGIVAALHGLRRGFGLRVAAPTVAATVALALPFIAGSVATKPASVPRTGAHRVAAHFAPADQSALRRRLPSRRQDADRSRASTPLASSDRAASVAPDKTVSVGTSDHRLAHASTYDERPARDTGLVCLHRVPGVSDTCLGPS